MLRSMTAYGRSVIAYPLGRFHVELQSVNRKHLEINTFLSKELLRFDSQIKNIIAAQVGRGAVQVKIHVVYDQQSPVTIHPNLPLARELKSAWDEIAKELGSKEPFSLAYLVKEPGLFVYEEELLDEKAYFNALTHSINEALIQFVTMKEVEGRALQQDIYKRFEHLKGAAAIIQQRAGTAIHNHRQKLTSKLKEVLGDFEHEERMLREIEVYAGKVDITEELARFSSHIQQCEDLLTSTQTQVGKPIEFLIQELVREANTMGSKGLDLIITQQVVAIKTELEKIREQIQNVE